MKFEFQPTPHLVEQDAQLLEREFNDAEFAHLRGLYVATQAIRLAERLHASGIPSALHRRYDDGTTVSLDITDDSLTLWKSLAFHLVESLHSDGLSDVAMAVIRRAHSSQ